MFIGFGKCFKGFEKHLRGLGNNFPGLEKNILITKGGFS
jgi:hypothetical protein